MNRLNAVYSLQHWMETIASVELAIHEYLHAGYGLDDGAVVFLEDAYAEFMGQSHILCKPQIGPQNDHII